MILKKQDINHLSHHPLAEGPEFVETFLSSWLPAGGQTILEPLKIYLKYIELLSETDILRGRNKQADKTFFLGYFYDQAALHSQDADSRKGYLEKALIYYQDYKKSGRPNVEAYYYCLLESGHIMNALEYAWSSTEQTFLMAFEFSPARAEPIEALMRHYIASGEWAIAYIFSAFSMAHFWGKPPNPYPKWGFHLAFYNWKVLDLHTSICVQLGGMEEARESFLQLFHLTQQRPELFSQQQMEKIHANLPLFQLSNQPC
jgi:hypothetical protein